MKLVVFGLSISSSWGNGHATLWRGLCKALAARAHHVVFFERDVPYYAAHRDLTEIPGGKLVLYARWEEIRAQAQKEIAGADVAIVTSFCPDGVAASELVLASDTTRVFYDLDTPITLEALKTGKALSFIGPRGLRDYDLVLSYTGGRALKEMQMKLGARRVAPLYGSVDPEVHRPTSPVERFRADLSYLGTYAADRQPMLEALFLEPARRLPHTGFLIGGSLYPETFPWAANIKHIEHVPPQEHPAFYCSSRLTLSTTRSAMAAMGYCPSGRLFEAAACGVPMLSDSWEGLDQFFEPGREIVTASCAEAALDALNLSDGELCAIARSARERVLSEHTAGHRAQKLEELLERARDITPDSLEAF
ncbi:MAG: glycosyltransferase [Verrucomicrobia bacterium]|nr:glycosyltransferase [Verrucomicrobiota bacterium]